MTAWALAIVLVVVALAILALARPIHSSLIAALMITAALIWVVTSWVSGDGRDRELLAGAGTVLIACAALAVGVVLIGWLRPTTDWVWVCLALFVAALASTAWQWSRQAFIAVSIITAFLLLDLLVGLGKSTQVEQARKQWPVQQNSALVTFDQLRPEYAALATPRPATEPQQELLKRARASLDALCDAINQSAPVTTSTTQATPPTTVTDCPVRTPSAQDEPHLQTLAEARATALDRMASARDSLEGTNTRDAADQALRQTLDNPPSDDVFDLVDLGAATMVNSVRSNTLPTTTLGLNGWLVVAATALLIFRWLLVLNSQNGWGPVEVHADDEQDDSKLTPEDHLRLVTIRSYLVANVPEPAAVPGTDAIIQVSELAAASAFGAQAWVKGLANFVAWALAPPTGHIIRFSYREQAASDDDDHSSTATQSVLTLRISTRGRSRVLETKTLTGATEAEVLRAAGYWAAGWIISRANFVPQWAKWSADSGPALGRCQTCIEQGSAGHAGTALNHQVHALEQARAEAPSSGLVLVRLAEAYQQQGRLLEALVLNLDTVRLYPAYPVARYRAAAVLSTLAHDHGVRWRNAVAADDGLTDRIVELLQPDEEDASRLNGAVRGSTADDDWFQALCEISAREFRKAGDAYRRPRMAGRTLRRSERRFNGQRFRVAPRVRDLYLSAIPVSRAISVSTSSANHAPAAPGTTTDLNEWKEESMPPNAWAGTVYNVACALAVGSCGRNLDEHERIKMRKAAMSLLAEAPTRYGGEQIKAAWVEADPDLEAIRDDPGLHNRYTLFIRSLDPKDQVNAMPHREDLVRGIWSKVQSQFNDSAADENRPLRAFLNPKLVLAPKSKDLAAQPIDPSLPEHPSDKQPPAKSFRAASLGNAVEMRCRYTIDIHELVRMLGDDTEALDDWFRAVWAHEAHLLEHFLTHREVRDVAEASEIRSLLLPPGPATTPAATATSAPATPAAPTTPDPPTSRIRVIASSSATEDLQALLATLNAEQVVAHRFHPVLATTTSDESRLEVWAPAKLTWDLAPDPDRITLIVEEQFRVNLGSDWVGVQVNGVKRS